jgi:hypothetical protein
MSKVDLFLELANPDETGNSRKVLVSEFVGKYEKLRFGNGGDWCRSDGSLAKKYIIERYKEGNSIVAVQLFGFNTKKQIQKSIRSDIVKEISSQKCAVLHISNVEVDHKDGHRDDYENLKPENQKVTDFQPLSPVVNKAKRQHCKVCRETKRDLMREFWGFQKKLGQEMGSIVELVLVATGTILRNLIRKSLKIPKTHLFPKNAKEILTK